MSLLSMIALSLFWQDGAIRDALATVDDETREFHEHIVVLSSQWMDGRLPEPPEWNVPRIILNTTSVRSGSSQRLSHALATLRLSPSLSLGTDFIRSGQAMPRLSTANWMSSKVTPSSC